MRYINLRFTLLTLLYFTVINHYTVYILIPGGFQTFSLYQAIFGHPQLAIGWRGEYHTTSTSRS